MNLRLKGQKMHIYISCGGNFENVKIYVNGNLLEYKPTCNYNKMIPLGNVIKGEKVNVIIEPVSDRFAVTSVYLYYENEDALKKHYEILSKNEVKLKEISGRKFEGTFNTENDRTYMVFSIPYDEGFTISVDGEKVDIINVSDGFMGVEILGSGEHIIKLSFIPEGFVVGAIISIFGIFMFVIWEKITTRNLLDE